MGWLESFEYLRHAVDYRGPRVACEGLISCPLAHGGEVVRVREEVGEFGGEVFCGALLYQVSVNAGGNMFAKSPGVCDEAGELVEHGFEGSDAKGLVE